MRVTIRKRRSDFISLKWVASQNELKPGTGKVIFIDEHPIALFNIQGEYFAMDNTCPHLGGSLGYGELNGDVVTCPWHGWEFNCRTGIAIENPSFKVKQYIVIKEKDKIYIEWTE